MHLKSITSCTGVDRNFRFGEKQKIPAPSLKQGMGRCVVGGEAAAANDFGAFCVKNKAFSAIKICLYV